MRSVFFTSVFFAIGPLTVTLVLATLAGVASAAGVTLVRDGRAVSVIVTPKDTVPGSVALAARELADYLEKATGARPPTVSEAELRSGGDFPHRIFIGPCEKTPSLEAEEFIIRTQGSDLFIAGGDRTKGGLEVRGTLNAVYEFLEEYLNVRWLFPGDLGEVVPRTRTLTVPRVRRRERPVNWQRKIRDSELRGHKDRTRAALKSWGVSVPEWEKNFSREITGAWFRRQKIGGRVLMRYGHSYGGWYKRYAEEHPDFFALQPDGTRRQFPERERLCVSNRALWDFVAELRIEELKRRPQYLAVSLSPNDGGKNKFCMCDRCRSWDPPEAPPLPQSKLRQLVDPRTGKPFERYPSLTDRYFRFYNEVARRVGRELPDRYLGVYAYSVYRTPPVSLKRIEPNLMVGFVGLNRDHITAWSKLASRLFIRPNDLWDGSFFGLPRNYAHHLASSVRFCVEHKACAFDFDGCVGNWGTQGLTYYVLARALWDPEIDVDAVTRDYCRAAYGRGARAMRRYYARLRRLDEQIRAEGRYRGRKENPHILPEYYTDALLGELQASLDEALRVIGASDDRAAARVRMVAEGVEYARQLMRLIVAANRVRTKADWQAYQGVKREVLQYLKDHCLSWSFTVPHNYNYYRSAVRGVERAAKARMR